MQCRPKIFSPLDRPRPPLSIPPSFAHLLGTPWEGGPPKFFSKICPWPQSDSSIFLKISGSIEHGPLYDSPKFWVNPKHLTQKNWIWKFQKNEIWPQVSGDSLIAQRRSFHRWTGLDSLYRATITIFQIWVPPGDEGPPNQFFEKKNFWLIDFPENFRVDRASTPLRSLKFLQTAIFLFSRKLSSNISVYENLTFNISSLVGHRAKIFSTLIKVPRPLSAHRNTFWH